MNKIKSFFCWLARGFIAISLVIITVLFIRKKKNVITNTYEKETRSQAEDRIRSTPAHAIAERYEDVADIIDAGRNRFAVRVKKRILEAGGSRSDGKHTD